jgi:hypothetical protein
VTLLSAHPDISELCESEIVSVLEIFSNSSLFIHRVPLNFLVNLIKFIDSHDIREKVKSIVTDLYTFAKPDESQLDCRLILGPDDSFLASLERKLTGKAQNELTNHVGSAYPGCYFKFYSKGRFFCLPNLFDDKLYMGNRLFIRADVHYDGTIVWEKDCNSWNNITFAFTSSSSSSLFVVHNSSPPAFFCAQIKSCKNLKEFKELLKTPEMKHYILYNDVTIMKSNVHFTIASPSKQPDNQDANV